MHKKEYETMRNFMSACLMAAATLGTATVLPMAAGASTINGLSNIANGGSYDMLGGSYYYGETFQAVDGGGFRDFTFTNSNTTAQNIILTTATVNALSAMFTNGLSFTWLTSGLVLNVAEALTNSSGTLDNVIAANGFDTLRISFGDPENRPGKNNGFATFNVELDAAAVPLPAGGLLLLTALGGVAALRRRKALAA